MRFGVLIKEWSFLQTLTLTGRSTGYYWMHCGMWRQASLCQHQLEMMASALVLCKSGFFSLQLLLSGGFSSILLVRNLMCTLSRLSGPKDFVSQGALTNNYLSGCGCGLGPLFDHIYEFFPSTQNFLSGWRVDLTSIIVPPFGAICGDDTNNLWILVESFFKSNCVLQILSYALALKFFPCAKL